MTMSSRVMAVHFLSQCGQSASRLLPNLLGDCSLLVGQGRLVFGREVEETGQQDVGVHFDEELRVGVDKDVFACQDLNEDCGYRGVLWRCFLVWPM